MSVSIKDSRCGEIYVSNKADKWTFFCSYCQKGTSDIGVFICHIRLDHLNGMLDCQSQNENRLTPQAERSIPITSELQSTPTLPLGVFFQTNEEQEAENNLIKEETLSQNSFNSDATPTRISEIEDNSTLNNSNETENVPSAQNSTSTAYTSIEKTEEFCDLTSRDPTTKKTSVLIEHEINYEIETEQKYVHSEKECNENESSRNKTNDEITIIIDEDINDTHSSSVYSLSDNDDDLVNKQDIHMENDMEISDNKEEAECWRYKCGFCDLKFIKVSLLSYHLKRAHDKKLDEMCHECKECNRKFRNISGLQYHIKNRHECPVCKVRLKKYFINHVLTHESDNCCPCNLCGKVFLNNDERVKHEKYHDNVKLFKCDFCFQSFFTQDRLNVHLKSHSQCQHCDNENEVESHKQPYVCTICGRFSRECRPELNSIPKAQIKTKRLN